MARDESAPWARGETYYNGGTIDTSDLGGINLEGKEYVFEVNAPMSPVAAQTDPSGRLVRVKVVRNNSGVNLKPARLAHFEAATTGPYGTRVDGYCTAAASVPAGVIDELLPAAGVPTGDLFYLVTEGPTRVYQGATTAADVSIGDRIVPVAYGATAGDNLGGRFAKQDLSGATTTLANQVQNAFGFAASANSTAGSSVSVVVSAKRW